MIQIGMTTDPSQGIDNCSLYFVLAALRFFYLLYFLSFILTPPAPLAQYDLPVLTKHTPFLS